MPAIDQLYDFISSLNLHVFTLIYKNKQFLIFVRHDYGISYVYCVKGTNSTLGDLPPTLQTRQILYFIAHLEIQDEKALGHGLFECSWMIKESKVIKKNIDAGHKWILWLDADNTSKKPERCKLFDSYTQFVNFQRSFSNESARGYKRKHNKESYNELLKKLEEALTLVKELQSEDSIDTDLGSIMKLQHRINSLIMNV